MKINKFYLNSLAEASVKNMYSMFANSTFNGDISKWNVSKVEDMESMFKDSKFNQDISSWDISSVNNLIKMFRKSEFNKNLGSWNLENKNIEDIFENSRYTSQQYLKDRIEFLDNLEFQKIENKLNVDIELDTIEMEF